MKTPPQWSFVLGFNLHPSSSSLMKIVVHRGLKIISGRSDNSAIESGTNRIRKESKSPLTIGFSKKPFVIPSCLMERLRKYDPAPKSKKPHPTNSTFIFTLGERGSMRLRRRGLYRTAATKKKKPVVSNMN